MSLGTSALKESIKSALIEGIPTKGDEDAISNAKLTADKLATALSTAIETFVKSGTVNFASGKVTGATPANGALTNGTATEGEIS